MAIPAQSDCMRSNARFAVRRLWRPTSSCVKPLAVLLSLLLATQAGAQTAEPCPKPLRVAFLDKPIPGLLNGNGQGFSASPGLFVEWLDATLAKLGCTAERVRVPQRRLLQDTAADVTQIVFYLAHTPERARQLAYPLRPDGEPQRALALEESRLVLYVLADRREHVQWDGRQLLPRSLKVGIVGGGVEEPMAMAAGWNLDRALSHTGSLAKLRMGRVDVAVLPQQRAGTLISEDEAPVVALDPPLHRILFYAPVSPAFMARHPAFVDRFWRTLCEVARARPAHEGSPLPACKA